jgi:hypothetical protein
MFHIFFRFFYKHMKINKGLFCRKTDFSSPTEYSPKIYFFISKYFFFISQFQVGSPGYRNCIRKQNQLILNKVPFSFFWLSTNLRQDGIHEHTQLGIRINSVSFINLVKSITVNPCECERHCCINHW